MVCEIGAFHWRILARATVHFRPKVYHALESRHKVGQGAVNTLWTKGCHMGDEYSTIERGMCYSCISMII